MYATFCVSETDLGTARSWLSESWTTGPIDYKTPDGPLYHLDTCLGPGQQNALSSFKTGKNDAAAEAKLRAQGFRRLELLMRREDAIKAAERHLVALASRPDEELIAEGLFRNSQEYRQVLNAKKAQLIQFRRATTPTVTVETLWGASPNP